MNAGGKLLKIMEESNMACPTESKLLSKNCQIAKQIAIFCRFGNLFSNLAIHYVSENACVASSRSIYPYLPPKLRYPY